MAYSAAWWGNLLGLLAYAVGVVALAGGALLSGRLGARWTRQRWLFAAHLWLSWAVVALGLAHGLLLWNRRGGAASFVQWWLPLGAEFIPLAVAAGPLALWLLAGTTASWYPRRPLGYPLWRWLHAISYPALAVTLWHGVEAGPDGWHPVLRAGYLGAIALAAGAVVVRLSASVQRHWRGRRPRPAGR